MRPADAGAGVTPSVAGRLQVGDSSLYYEVTGTGHPVVLLHGFAVDRRLWDDQIGALSHLHTVVRYDLRGFGRSTIGGDGYSHADDLKALLDHLQIARAAVVGLSLGGGAAINFAIAYPNAVQALLLMAPTLGGFSWSPAVTASQRAVRTAAKEQGLQAARALWLQHRIFQAAMTRPAVAQSLETMVGEYSGWHWLHDDPSRQFTPPAIERLGEIAAPTLVAVGALDIEDFHQIAATLEAGIPDVWKVVVPDVGHILNMEAPERCNEMVTAFLAETERRSRR